ncbi:XRE family transcriptional regulator [Streptomyces scopuliridis]|uniref:XRE family transcriptional regulator n=1 Tax=Streptomyces scopuliridis TaxID=452529 RepID=UPI00367BD985
MSKTQQVGVTHTTEQHGVRMPKVFRKGDGQPLRDEMERQGLSGPELADKTKRVDPEGRGVSAATIGRVAGKGRTARDRCELSTAWLITEGLDARIHRLFRMPSRSTMTIERSRSDAEEE